MWVTRFLIGFLMVLLTLFLLINGQNQNCPHAAAGIKDWSNSASWPNNMVPVEGDIVTIDSSIRLDKSPGIVFNGIVITASGQLTFVPEVADGLLLETKYIHIQGGRMDIGAENCPYLGFLNIRLIGDPGESYNVVNFGQKFIGVDVNGTLEIHGEEKLSWTKLNKTLEKMPAVAEIYEDTVDDEDKLNGLVVYDWDPVTRQIREGDGDRPVFKFRKGRNSLKQEIIDRELERFQNYVNGVLDGHVVALSIRKTLIGENDNRSYSGVLDAIEELAYGEITNKSLVRQLQFYDGYAAILVKGEPHKTVESFSAYKSDGLHQTSTATLIDGGLKYEVISYTKSKQYAKSYAKFEVTDAQYSVPKITLSQPADSWTKGDRVVISSTDYDYKQMEVGSVVECDDCTEYEHRIDLTVKFMHFGEIYKNTDMRAEVGLISRNVVIEGDTLGGDDNGGHIKMIRGFENAHIEGAELRFMGNSIIKGRYPIHWHLCGDVDIDNGVTTPSYARSNSIHNSYARCCTIHGTHGAEVSDNVCMGSKGHGFFLEDGDETRTKLLRNLGMGQTVTSGLIPTDKKRGLLLICSAIIHWNISKPSTFWITHPNNIVKDNVGAGGEGYGVWYVFPNFPMGPSAKHTSLTPGEAKITPIENFENNVIHSYMMIGLHIDKHLDSNGEALSKNEYEPSSRVTLFRLTAYKNAINALISGTDIQLERSSVSDGAIGMALVAGLQTVVNCVVLGDSVNRGEPLSDLGLDRSLPVPEETNTSRMGLMFGPSPLYINGTYFDDFPVSDLYDSGAIGFLPDNKQPTYEPNEVRNARFGFIDATDGNRVFVPPESASSIPFIDVDSSVTGKPGTTSTIIRPYTFQLTDNCLLRDNWHMAICEEIYGQVTVSEPAQLTRVDNEASQTAAQNEPFNVVLNSSLVYIMKLDDGVSFSSVPRLKAFHIDGVESAFVIGLCVPKNAEFTIISFNPRVKMSSVDSVELVKSSNGQKYFYDSSIGVIYLKFVGPDPNSNSQACSGEDFCRKFNIKLESGNPVENNDCTQAAINDLNSGTTRNLPTKTHTKKRTNRDKRLWKILQKLLRAERGEKLMNTLSVVSQKRSGDIGTDDRELQGTSLPENYGAGNTKP